ncbi:MAG: acyl carrier protein [Syntrophomonadaceae bacterium]|nr:acyl carrier protein [Syntrophomonadaceae bacterium]
MREKAAKAIYREIKSAILEVLDVPEDMVSLDTSFSTDLNADSIDVVEILMRLEDKFGLEIPEETARNIRTVRDMVEYIEQRLREK